MSTRYSKDFADTAFLRLSKDIQKVYLDAYNDIVQKLEEHTKEFEKKEKELAEKAKKEEITWAYYQAWKKQAVFAGKQWERKRDQMINQMYKASTTATKIINGERQAVFIDTVNYAEYQIDKDFKFGVSFDLYDSATVTRLLADDPELLPNIEIDREKQEKWDKRSINTAITQSIIQGETMQQTADRIAKKLSVSDEKSAMRTARTAMTSAQNSGRIEAMHNAEDKGIQVEKVWIATLDDRTRESHQDLDGQTAKVDEPFDSLLGPIMFPGDPDADPANVYNCRCTLGWDYPEYRNQYDTRAARDDEGNTVEVEDMTYSEWAVMTGRRQKEEEKQNENTLKDAFTSEIEKIASTAQSEVDFWMSLSSDQQSEFLDRGYNFREFYNSAQQNVEKEKEEIPEYRSSVGNIEELPQKTSAYSDLIIVKNDTFEDGHMASAMLSGQIEVNAHGLGNGWKEILDHEVGHQIANLDSNIQFHIVQNTGDVFGRYNQRQMHFEGLYGEYNAEEAFATGFSVFLNAPHDLEERYPLAYNFFKTLVDNSPQLVDMAEQAEKQYRREFGV